MTELSQAKPTLPGVPLEQVDVIDFLAGIAPGDWLDQLRRARPETRAQAQRSHEA